VSANYSRLRKTGWLTCLIGSVAISLGMFIYAVFIEKGGDGSEKIIKMINACLYVFMTGGIVSGCVIAIVVNLSYQFYKLHDRNAKKTKSPTVYFAIPFMLMLLFVAMSYYLLSPVKEIFFFFYAIAGYAGLSVIIYTVLAWRNVPIKIV
jgi:uncharacterized protein YacL